MGEYELPMNFSMCFGVIFVIILSLTVLIKTTKCILDLDGGFTLFQKLSTYVARD